MVSCEVGESFQPEGYSDRKGGVIGVSVIVSLSEQVEPSRRTLIRSAVREFEKEAEEAQGYLPAVIKLKNRLDGIGNASDP